MPLLKLSLTNEEMTRLEELAREEDLSLQDYIRYTIFGDRNPAKFTPEEAERRAVENIQQMMSHLLYQIFIKKNGRS